MTESEYFQSEEFKKSYEKSIRAANRAIIYIDDNGDTIKEWEDGRIEIIKNKDAAE